MLKISRHQLDALEQVGAPGFEERTARRLREHFNTLAATGEEELRSTIRLGIERAAAHGIRSDYNVALYIGAMVQFGVDFDRDGRCPWAEEILSNGDIDATTKLAMIYTHTSSDE